MSCVLLIAKGSAFKHRCPSSDPGLCSLLPRLRRLPGSSECQIVWKHWQMVGLLGLSKPTKATRNCILQKSTDQQSFLLARGCTLSLHYALWAQALTSICSNWVKPRRLGALVQTLSIVVWLKRAQHADRRLELMAIALLRIHI